MKRIALALALGALTTGCMPRTTPNPPHCKPGTVSITAHHGQWECRYPHGLVTNGGPLG